MKWVPLLLLSLTLFGKEPFFATFTPPEKWLVADPSKYEKGVKIGFIESTRRVFSPSITLTLEKVGTVAMETYLSALRKIHQQHSVQELGTFQTKVGKTHLIQIDMQSEWGEIRLLQAISLSDGYALIQTGACLKNEFLTIHETFLNSFKSLTIYPDVLTSCPDFTFQKKTQELARSFKKYCATSKGTPATLFKTSFFQQNQWQPFVKYLEEELKSKGACWQLLALRHIQESLLTENGI